MDHIKSIGLLNDDPKIDYKKKVFKFLGIKPEIVKDVEKCNRKSGILDLSSFLEVKDVEKYLEKFSRVIVSPLAASGIAPVHNNKIYTAYPLRQWAIARKIEDMSAKNICGNMTSIRILWSVPRKLSSGKKTFLYSTVAGLVDLANCMAQSPLKMMYLEKVKKGNNLFGLLTYKNGIALELEINEMLPNTMESARFIKANFTAGSLTNMPLVGFHNEEGSLLADNRKLIHTVVEDHQWDGIDEIENTYWQMLLAIDGGTYPDGPLHSRIIIDAINKTIKNEAPVNLEC